MSPTDLLTPDEAAEYLRLPVRQLQQWRYLGKGPAFIRLERAVRYRRGDLDDWLRSQTVRPENVA